jgi:NADH-quinone oxidoreductase subunit G
MEFLLINHPLDCPICDKGGECPLQNQAMTNGQGETRFEGTKRTFPKPINVSAQVLLDRERCVSCARCTRFADQIAGDPFIELLERGAKQQVGTSEDQPFDSYFSGNTIQICPVGALTSAKYRFRSRPFDLISTPTACEHCASGCALRTDVRRSTVMRRLAWDAPEVNEEWNCDKGRFAFPYTNEARLTHPLVRDEAGNLVPASWPEALRVAAAGLAKTGTATAVLTGGRVTVEDAQSYASFARDVIGTNDVDFRARAVSNEETAFLANHVANKSLDVTYGDLEAAKTVLLVSFEPEDESPIVFLRLRKAALSGTTKVFAVAPYTSAGLAKMKGTLLAAGPREEVSVITSAATHLSSDSVVLVGERAAQTPGALTAVAELVAKTGAKLAWIPRRAGDRGALDAGLLPINGRNTSEIVAATGSAIKGLVVG